MFALFALPALIQGFMRPTIDTYVNQHTPSDTRATVLSVSSLVLSVQVAFFEPVVGWITDEVSIRAAFGFVSVFFLLVMPPMFYLWRKAYVPTPEPAAPQLAAAEAA
jgi:MFS family permease